MALIRKMQKKDIDAILLNFAEQGWPKPRETIENYFARQAGSELFVFVAEHQGDVAGYAVLYPSAKTGPFANKNIPEISDFNVFAKYRQIGIGSSILDSAEKKAAELCNQVTLGVGLHYGYGAAQRIYAKRGYIPDGTGVWYKNSHLEQYADCKNDDDLVLYLAKVFDKQ